MKPEFIVAIVVALVGGGAMTGLGALFGARAQFKKARQDDERLPAEVESLWLGGAEKAVGSLQAALDRAESQIGRLEAALEKERQRSNEKDRRIETLEHDLAEARRRMDDLQARLDRLGVRISEMRDPEDGVT